jgi:hypothetical protein
MTRSYEVIGYDCQGSFDRCAGEVLDENLIYKRDAIKIGKHNLNRWSYPIVKIQSNDRKFIEIFSVKGMRT